MTINIHTNDDGQEWATAWLRLEFTGRDLLADIDRGYEAAAQLIAELRRRGFGVTGSSVGTRYRVRGCEFDGIEVIVDAVRGGRPSAIELKMQSTFSGRD